MSDLTFRPGFSYRFSAAIVRRPGRSVAGGIRAIDRGPPDCARFRQEHSEYIRALERAGVRVTVLDALEAHPDSVFIEDAALCLPDGIVLLRPGAPSRTGEAAALGATLEQLGHLVIACQADGFIDGGDIFTTESAIFVGLSERTERRGFAWLGSILERRGYPVRAVRTPAGVLHFKSDCCVLDGELKTDGDEVLDVGWVGAPTGRGEGEGASYQRNKCVCISISLSRINEVEANKKHKLFSSLHEGYAVLLEEVDELWDAIKENAPDESKRRECIQVAAMAIKLLMSNVWSRGDGI